MFEAVERAGGAGIGGVQRECEFWGQWGEEVEGRFFMGERGGKGEGKG